MNLFENMTLDDLCAVNCDEALRTLDNVEDFLKEAFKQPEAKGDWSLRRGQETALTYNKEMREKDFEVIMVFYKGRLYAEFWKGFRRDLPDFLWSGYSPCLRLYSRDNDYTVSGPYRTAANHIIMKMKGRE